MMVGLCIFQGIDSMNTLIGYIRSNDYGYKNRHTVSMTGIVIKSCSIHEIRLIRLVLVDRIEAFFAIDSFCVLLQQLQLLNTRRQCLAVSKLIDFRKLTANALLGH